MHQVVFLVEHLYEHRSGEEVVKTIGLYASRQSAEEAVARAKLLPGFCDRPDDFNIDASPLDQDHWTSGFVGAEIGWPMDNEEGATETE